eukprot:1800279-Pyramimonas_sp.AAC.1
MSWGLSGPSWGLLGPDLGPDLGPPVASGFWGALWEPAGGLGGHRRAWGAKRQCECPLLGASWGPC